MNAGKTLFAQIMEFIPWTSFSCIVTRYAGVRRMAPDGITRRGLYAIRRAGRLAASTPSAWSDATTNLHAGAGKESMKMSKRVQYPSRLHAVRALPRAAGIACLCVAAGFAWADETSIKEDAARAGQTAGSAVQSAAQDTKRVAGEAVDGVKKVGSDVVQGAKQIGGEIADGAKHAGTEVAHGAKTVGSEVAASAKKAGAEVARTAKTVGTEVGEGARTVGRVVGNAARQGAAMVRDVPRNVKKSLIDEKKPE